MDSLLSFSVGLFIPNNMPVYPGALQFADPPLSWHCPRLRHMRWPG